MPTVLIIDDEPNIRRMVGALLAAEGYDVRDASDGASGALRATENEPDVVLLGLMMPGGVDGISARKRSGVLLPSAPPGIMRSGSTTAGSFSGARGGPDAPSDASRPAEPAGGGR